MGPSTNPEPIREEFCFGMTHERKYYKYDKIFFKRSIRQSEWRSHGGVTFVPKLNKERIINEGACLKFLWENTNIPLPKLYACFEDDGVGCLMTEYVDGVGMDELTPEKKNVVIRELMEHLTTLKTLTSSKWGGLAGSVLPPYRVMRMCDGPWHMRDRKEPSLVFCHNDLSENNVLVDPSSLKIKAIIDWEYAGFFPSEFERPFYERSGPSIALSNEVDDVDTLLELMNKEKA
ncbi:uncharacterized protein PpBr36_11428 [Pyricularia pennisetigena]|uniref:uncharacterized protein n=1 Tax=Pyricularia pennisetigena TaxID=1578925 RepID=UPI00114FAC00|nr:uncharacterized protein PpBr36_11428 [Pyricularia pennisetigena]TLS20312.1 hypothetical protein PpBr36_11428 [Pyricularia pennisetigena]